MFTKKKNFDLFLHCSFLLAPVALKLFEIFPRRTQKELSSKMSRGCQKASKSVLKCSFRQPICAIKHNPLLCYSSRPLGGCSCAVWGVVCRRRTGLDLICPLGQCQWGIQTHYSQKTTAKKKKKLSINYNELNLLSWGLFPINFLRIVNVHSNLYRINM